MRVLKMVCISVIALTFVVQAKNTYSVFSVGLAMPMSSATMTDTLGGTRNLKNGWDGGWTFFGLPFTKSGSVLSGLAFGGKISYSRWVRDSTLKELTFLGTQGIVRYYLPFHLNRFDFFGQVGCGMFIGEHGYSDPDTINRTKFPQPELIIEGKKNTGVSINLGMDWDVMEVTPGMTIVLTKGKPSTWFSLSAAAKF
jgi:hypothetical protein